MRKLLFIIFLLLLSRFSFAQKLSEQPIIPKVQRVIDYQYAPFLLDSHVGIQDFSMDSGIIWEMNYLKNFLKKNFKANQSTTAPNRIILLYRNEFYDTLIGNEGYILRITTDTILIKANTEVGIFYGIQTLKQLVLLNKSNQDKVLLPAGEIFDYPEYAYRGMMLDVARHFFPVDDVEKLIDYLALFKINHLHIHLSDDQGWRIEIKSYPKLAQIGGKTQVGGSKAGYYTQEQFKQLVNYAGHRGIEIVPEIDMPGHINAALASYAFLNCDGQKRKLYTGTRVGFSSLCTSKDTVYKFISSVVYEISRLYNGKYFHIGGDESGATPHDEYLKFIDSIQKIVTGVGKIMIGWDEIAQAKLYPGTIVQFWVHKKFAQKAADEGHKILISYAPYCYMDMKYNDSTTLGLHWAGYLNLYKAYNWLPDTLLNIDKKQILGIEAPLWTETIKNLDDIEFMTFPRICSYAEIGWTAGKKRSWVDFRKRLAYFSKIFDYLRINYYHSPYINWH